MHDERVEAWPFLGGKHLGDGARVERIGAKPIDGIGGKGHNIAANERLGSSPYGVWRGRNDGHGAISRVTRSGSS